MARKRIPTVTLIDAYMAQEFMYGGELMTLANIDAQLLECALAKVDNDWSRARRIADYGLIGLEQGQTSISSRSFCFGWIDFPAGTKRADAFPMIAAYFR